MITLQTAKKLTEACEKKGVEIPPPEEVYNTDDGKNWINNHGYAFDCSESNVLPAYSTDELLEWLPHEVHDISVWHGNLRLHIEKCEKHYLVMYESDDGECPYIKKHKHLVNALALLIIELIDKDLMV